MFHILTVTVYPMDTKHYYKQIIRFYFITSDEIPLPLKDRDVHRTLLRLSSSQLTSAHTISKLDSNNEAMISISLIPDLFPHLCENGGITL